MRGWRLVLAIALSCAAAAHGQDDSEEIVVRARAETPAEHQAPTAFVTSIDTEQHSEQLETVTDALAETVGVQVRRYGGLGSFSTISIRGSSSNQVQIYFDGIPLSRARNETVNLADLPLDSLERIDVYRGTVPLSFGVAGLAGVVNLVPKQPSETPSAELEGSYGSFDTRKAVASYSQRLGGFGVLAHLTYLGSEGDFRFFDRSLRPDESPHQQRINNSFDSLAGLWKVQHDVGKHGTLDLTSELFFKDEGIPGAGAPQIAHASFDELRSTSFLRLTESDLANGAVDASATLFGSFLNEQLEDPERELGAGRQDRDDVTTQVGGNFGAVWRAPLGNELSWFSEVSSERFAGVNHATRLPQNRHDPVQARLRAAVGVQDQLRLLADRITIVPTLRYERIDDQGDTFNLQAQPIAPSSQSHSLWNPGVGVQLLPLPWLALRANLARLERAPSFTERFGNRGTILGNPDLKPEHGLLRDIGLRIEQPLSFVRARLEYAYFNNDIDDLIVLVANAGVHAVRSANVGSARLRGHEVTLGLKLPKWLELDFNYTNQDAENRDPTRNTGEQLPGRPAHELYARAQFATDWWKIYYELNYIAEDYIHLDNRFGRVGSREFHTAGAQLSCWDWLTLGFEARNLGNDGASDVYNYPLPGRSFFGSVKVKL